MRAAGWPASFLANPGRSNRYPWDYRPARLGYGASIAVSSLITCRWSLASPWACGPPKCDENQSTDGPDNPKRQKVRQNRKIGDRQPFSRRTVAYFRRVAGREKGV